MNKPTPQKPLFVPKNEDELSIIEKHIQLTLKDNININITSRRANKLRNLTCCLAGFPNGYQQLKTYWNKNENNILDNSFLLELLRSAINNNSEHLVISANNDSYSVFLRKNGMLQLERKFDCKNNNKITELTKNLKNVLKINDIENGTNFYFNIELNKTQYRLRVSSLICINNKIHINIKITNMDKEILNINELGITKVNNLKESLKLKGKIILVSGITGSGKTTTVSAMTQEFIKNKKQNPTTKHNKNENNVLINNIPDFVNIGEIITQEDALAAIQSANNGSLVISTIHSGSVNGAIIRFNLLSGIKKNISNKICCVVAQALIGKKCSMCEGEGCIHCNLTGIDSRVLVSEVLLLDGNKIDKENINTNKNSIFNDALIKYKEKEINQQQMINHFGDQFDIKK